MLSHGRFTSQSDLKTFAASMEQTAPGADSLSSSSSDKPMNCKEWERFLPARPLRILLVEDDSSSRQVVSALLSECGYEVSCVWDGSKAWELLEQSEHRFDLVLADAMMPVLSGTDLLAKIILSESHCNIPVIMMSAHDSLDMVFKCLLRGAKDFLVKPLRKNELRNLWQHVWRRNHACAGVCQVDHKSKLLCTRPENCQDLIEANESLSSTEQGDHLKTTLKSNKALTSSKAFDFLKTVRAEPEQEQAFSEVAHAKQEMASPQIFKEPQTLTKTTMNTRDDAQNDPVSKKGVRQSTSSAFSKYVSNTALVLQPCVVKSIALPNDKHASGCSSTGNMIDGDAGSRIATESCDKVHDRRTVSGNDNSITLHFPIATHFKHRVQERDSPFLRVSSCHEENSGQVQESLSNVKCPSLISSTANNPYLASKGGTIFGDDPLERVDLQKDAHIAGSVGCSTGSNKEDFCSGDSKICQLLPRSNTDCAITHPNDYNLHGQSSMPRNVDEPTNELPAYIVFSGRGSNSCSDRGSSVIEEHLTGKSGDCVGFQDGQSVSGWNMNENCTMDLDSSGMHAFDVCNAPDQRPLVYNCQRASFREAALLKFREKRKLRCFEKRVRYQSRKKLAEQRPRIKGQFVRRATIETAGDVKTSSNNF